MSLNLGFHSNRPSRKPKLLILAGAGAAVEFGMPSVSDVDHFLSGVAQEYFSLVDCPDSNLYKYIHKNIQEYWQYNTGLQNKNPSFEDVLYTISTLHSVVPAGYYTGNLGAFVTLKALPMLNYFGKCKQADISAIRNLGGYLVDALLEKFRALCRAPVPTILPRIEELRNFITDLSNAYEIAVVTTNYDDMLYRCLPWIETGFDNAHGGRFNPRRIVGRDSWPCLLHLHGSVHFDMDYDNGNLHAVMWKEDLNESFHQNSLGRNSVLTNEGNVFPTSSIIAGYGKSDQIQRFPFRTYYSELDRLVAGSDALLLLGCSFRDAHIEQSFTGYRDGRDRPVVVVDYANDDTMLAGFEWSPEDAGAESATRALRVFQVPPNSTEALGCRIAQGVNDLKAAREFERSTIPGNRVSIWYNGMLEACRATDTIINELRP